MTSQTREAPDVDATMAVFDLDGTITRHDTYIPFLLGFLARKPLRILRCGLLPFHALMHLLGLRGNSWLKLKFLSQCCGGASRQALADYGADFAARIVRKGLLPDAVAAIEFHRARGDRLVLISASFDFYVDEIGKLLGFDHVIASKAAWRSDGDRGATLTGRFDGENCQGASKLKRLNAHLANEKRDRLRIIAYSDHRNDLPLLAFADTAYVVNPNHRMRRLAASKGFAVLNWPAALPARGNTISRRLMTLSGRSHD
jgi:phosphatidylglycerophosphatase C